MAFNQKQNLRAEIETEFGKLTARQLWVVTKLAKMVRLRCRNNTAFNNAFNEIFPHAQFKTINKSRISRVTGQTESYPGLQITVAAETISEDETEE